MATLGQAKRLVIKIGSALLVDRSTGTLRENWLASLADDIAHKSEVGGVRVGVKNIPELEQVLQEIYISVRSALPNAAADQFLIQVQVFKTAWLFGKVRLKLD